MTSRRQTWLTLLLVSLAIGVRLALVAQAGGCQQDPDNYLPLARSLVEGKGYRFNKKPTAYRPPLYPVVLTPFVKFSGDLLPWTVGVFHAGLGGITVLLTGAYVRRAVRSPMAPWMAMTIVAFDPVLAVQARGVMTETMAACLTAFSLWGASLPGRKGGILGGLAFGLAVLCRPSLLPGAVLVAFARIFNDGDRVRDWLVNFVLFWFMLVLVLSPWIIRNLRVFGEPIWATTHGGYTLALANNPFYYADVLEGPPGAVWSGGENQEFWESRIYRATMMMSEPDADRAIGAGAIGFMIDHPAQAFRASLARLGRFWGVAPAEAVYPRLLRLITASWTIPLWFLALAGLLTKDAWRWPGLGAVFVVIGLTCVHTFYWTDLRMRAPVLPALAAIASASLAWRPAGFFQEKAELGENP